MPRSRRRAGVKPGKTLTQLWKQKRAARRKAHAAAVKARADRESQARRERFAKLEDKYASYPGNQQNQPAQPSEATA